MRSQNVIVFSFEKNKCVAHEIARGWMTAYVMLGRNWHEIRSNDVAQLAGI